MKKVDYCKTILYPFTLDIRESNGKIIAQCQQIPGIILQFESIEELQAEFVRILDSWYRVTEKVRKQKRTKK